MNFLKRLFTKVFICLGAFCFLFSLISTNNKVSADTTLTIADILPDNFGVNDTSDCGYAQAYLFDGAWYGESVNSYLCYSWTGGLTPSLVFADVTDISDEEYDRVPLSSTLVKVDDNTYTATTYATILTRDNDMGTQNDSDAHIDVTLTFNMYSGYLESIDYDGSPRTSLEKNYALNGGHKVSLSVNNSLMGSVSATPYIAATGTTISLSATPNEGYAFVKWESTDVTITNNQFTMINADVSVNAVFKKVSTFEEFVDFLNGEYSSSVTTSHFEYVVTADSRTLKLLTDVSHFEEITKQVVIQNSDNVTIDLNGHVVDLTYNTTNLFKVLGSLTITDTSLGDSVHYFASQANGTWRYSETSTSNTINGGVITGIYNDDTSHPSFAMVNGSLSLSRVKFVGNQTDAIAGNTNDYDKIGIIHSSAGSLLDINECEFSHNVVTLDDVTSGYQLYGCVIDALGDTTISNTDIINNHVNTDSESTYIFGGVIYSTASLTINNSKLYAPQKTYQGGVISAFPTGSNKEINYEISGESVLKGNTPTTGTSMGGIIYIQNSAYSYGLITNLTIDDALLTEGKSKNGGAIWAYCINIYVKGHAAITNCDAENYAVIYSYGISTADLVFEMCEDVVVEGNTGSISLIQMFYVKDVKIHGNTQILNNELSSYGLLHISNSKIDIYDDVLIDGNTVGSNLIDIYSSTVNIYGNTKISNNTYPSGSVLEITSSEVSIYGKANISYNVGSGETGLTYIINTTNNLFIYGDVVIANNKFTKAGIYLSSSSTTYGINISDNVKITANTKSPSKDGMYDYLMYVYMGNINISGSVSITDNSYASTVIGVSYGLFTIDGEDVNISRNSAESMIVDLFGTNDNKDYHTITGKVTFANNTVTQNAIIYYVNCGLTIDGEFKAISNVSHNGVIHLISSLTSATDTRPTLEITDATFTKNRASSGASIYSDGYKNNNGFSNNSITVTDCTFDENQADYYGAAIYVVKYTDLYISGCSFTNNFSGDSGAVSLNDITSTADISDCEFTGNTAKDGGAIALTNTGALIRNVTMTNNTATEYGGAIYGYLYINTNYPILLLEDTTITGNSAYSNGGGMYVDGRFSFVLAGSTVIDGNSFYEYVSDVKELKGNSNLCLQNRASFIFGTKTLDVTGNGFKVPTSDMFVSLSSLTNFGGSANIRISDIPAPDYIDLLKLDSDSLGYDLGLDSNNYIILFKHSHDGKTFERWTSTTTLPTYGNYYLTNDVTITETVEISSNLTLCLNGHDIINNSGKEALSIMNSKYVYIYDCGTNTRNGLINSNGLFEFDEDGDIEIKGGAIIGGAHTTDTGASAIYLSSYSNLYLYGGNFVGNYSKNSSTISINNFSNVTFNGANAIGNVGANGGVVFATHGSSIMFDCGTFSYNTATNGGVCYIEYGSSINTTIQNSKNIIFKNNKALENGGVIYSIKDTRVTPYSYPDASVRLYAYPNKADSKIIVEYNEAGLYGGAFYGDSGSKYTLTNVEISNNRSGKAGGAIALVDSVRAESDITDTPSCTMMGLTTISGNISGAKDGSLGAGGGIYMLFARLSIYDDSYVALNDTTDPSYLGKDIYITIYHDEDGFDYGDVYYSNTPTSSIVTEYYVDALSVGGSLFIPTLAEAESFCFIRNSHGDDISEYLSLASDEYKIGPIYGDDDFYSLGLIPLHAVFDSMGGEVYQGTEPHAETKWLLDDSNFVFVGWFDDPLVGNECTTFVDGERYYGRWKTSDAPDAKYILTSGIYVTPFGLFNDVDLLEMTFSKIIDDVLDRISRDDETKLEAENLTFKTYAEEYELLNLANELPNFEAYGIYFDPSTLTVTFDNVNMYVSSYVVDMMLDTDCMVSTIFCDTWKYVGMGLYELGREDLIEELDDGNDTPLHINVVGDNMLCAVGNPESVCGLINAFGNIYISGTDKSEDKLTIDLGNINYSGFEVILGAFSEGEFKTNLYTNDVSIILNGCTTDNGFLVMFDDVQFNNTDFTLTSAEGGWFIPFGNKLSYGVPGELRLSGNSYVTIKGAKGADDSEYTAVYYYGDIIIEDTSELHVYGSTDPDDEFPIAMIIENDTANPGKVLIKDQGVLVCDGYVLIAQYDDELVPSDIIYIEDGAFVSIIFELDGELSSDFINSDHIIYGGYKYEDNFYIPLLLGLKPVITVNDLENAGFVYGSTSNLSLYSIATESFNKFMSLTVEWYVDGSYTSIAPEGLGYTYDTEKKTINISASDSVPAGTYKIRISNGVELEIVDTIDTSKMIDNPFYTCVEKEFTIAKAKVTKPQEDSTTFTYSGSEQTYTIAASSLYTVTGNKATTVGSHTVVIALNDKENYEWADNTTTDLEYEFVIGKAQATKPTADATSFTYTGEEQTYSISASSLYTVSGNKHTNAGSYTVTISLVDKDSSEWADGTTLDLSFTFIINQAENEILTLTYASFVEGATPSTPVETHLFGEVKYMYSVDKAQPSFDVTIPTKAGNYIIKAYVVGNEDYSNAMKEVKYTIYQNKSNVIVDEAGNEVENPEVNIVDAPNGLDPNAILVIKVIDVNESSNVDSIQNLLIENRNISSNELVFGLYDAKLLVNNVEVEATGTVTIKMLVPEAIRDKEFKLFHIHTNADGSKEITQVECSQMDSEFYVTFTVNKLSEFAFICTKEASKANDIMFIFQFALLLIGGLLWAFFYFKKNNCFAALIAAGSSLVVSVVLTFFGPSALSIAASIIDIFVFAGLTGFTVYVKYFKKK